jgi:hypothetical protein
VLVRYLVLLLRQVIQEVEQEQQRAQIVKGRGVRGGSICDWGVSFVLQYLQQATTINQACHQLMPISISALQLEICTLIQRSESSQAAIKCLSRTMGLWEDLVQREHHEGVVRVVFFEYFGSPAILHIMSLSVPWLLM